jgi:hypothetical protein
VISNTQKIFATEFRYKLWEVNCLASIKKIGSSMGQCDQKPCERAITMTVAETKKVFSFEKKVEL